MKVTVCVITYKRPDGLKLLLDSLNKLIFHKIDTPDLDIIVVDNDSTGSSCEICEKTEVHFKWSLKYFIEEYPGISSARNKAISCVEENVKFIAFIDDDEIAEPNWLDELLYVQRIYNADVVCGPVLSWFNENTAYWIIKGNFFNRFRYPTGYHHKDTYSGNVLIRADILRKMDKLFDERFGLTGGEDTHFFMRIYRAGHKIVRADEAVVYELVPKSRTNAKWILQRAYSSGNSLSLCELDIEHSFTTILINAVRGSKEIIKGMLLLPTSFIMGRHIFIRALVYICQGAGMLAALGGIRYEEYRRTTKM